MRSTTGPSGDLKSMVLIRVNIVVRPTHRAAATALVTLPRMIKSRGSGATAKAASLAMRQPTVADVFIDAWAQFTALIDQRGALWGPLPSVEPKDFCLRLSRPTALSSEDERVPRPVNMTAIIRQQPELRDDVPVAALLDDTPEACVDLSLCDAFILREEVEASESRTRASMLSLFCESFDALAAHLNWKYARAYERDLQHKNAADARTALDERERAQRSLLERDALAKLADVGADAAAGHQRLEPAHIALMTRTLEMRRKLREDMERVTRLIQ